MSTPFPNPLSSLKAEARNGLSALAPHTPPNTLGKLLGWNKENHVPVRWRFARGQNPDHIMERFWIDYEGEPASGRTPKTYQKVGLMSIFRTMTNYHLREHAGEQAVARAEGGILMIGTAIEGELFSLDPDNDHRYMLGIGIGRTAFRASLGIRTPDGLFEPMIDRISDEGTRHPSEISDIHIVS